MLNKYFKLLFWALIFFGNFINAADAYFSQEVTDQVIEQSDLMTLIAFTTVNKTCRKKAIEKLREIDDKTKLLLGKNSANQALTKALIEGGLPYDIMHWLIIKYNADINSGNTDVQELKNARFNLNDNDNRLARAIVQKQYFLLKALLSFLPINTASISDPNSAENIRSRSELNVDCRFKRKGYLHRILHLGIEYTSDNIFELLVSDERIQKNWEKSNNDGHSPLTLAIKNKDLEKIKILLKARYNLNSKIGDDYEYSFPIHCAAKYKDPEIIKLLLAEKADVNAKSSIEETPVFTLINYFNKYNFSNDSKACLDLLIEARASLNLPNKHNQTVLDMALEKFGEASVPAELLRKYYCLTHEEIEDFRSNFYL